MHEVRIATGSELENHQLGEICCTDDHSFLVVAIHKLEGTVIVDSPLDCKIEQGDKLMVLCRSGQSPKLTVKAKSHAEILYRSARLAASS